MKLNEFDQKIKDEDKSTEQLVQSVLFLLDEMISIAEKMKVVPELSGKTQNDRS